MFTSPIAAIAAVSVDVSPTSLATSRNVPSRRLRKSNAARGRDQQEIDVAPVVVVGRDDREHAAS